MTYSFSPKSLERLSTVHPLLQKLFNEAIKSSPYDFSITEGIRSVDRQRYLVDTGKSTTMNSRHLSGKAVDIAVFKDGKVTWTWEYYQEVARHIKDVAAVMSIPIVWGGDWESFKDGPHFELNRKAYP